MDIVKMLEGHAFFRSFRPEQVDEISRFSHSKTLEAGTVVYKADQKATHIFVLLSGEVRLHLPSQAADTAVLVSRVSEGGFFGIAPLMGSDRYTTVARCARQSKILFIESAPLLEMLGSNPAIGQQVMTMVAGVYFDRYVKMLKRLQNVLADLSIE